LAGWFDHQYLLTAGVVGLLYVVVTPPFQVPDEPNHFYRCYQLTRAQIFSKRQDNLWGGELPRSLVYVVEDTAGSPGYQPEAKSNLQAIMDGLHRPLRPWKTMFVHFPNTAIYSPVPYIPQGVGILSGRILRLPPLILLYLGRLTNFAVAILLCAAAIKLTPVFRGVLFLTAATPMFIYEAASLSADALTDGLSLLFIALILRCAFGPEPLLKTRDMLLILALGAAIGLCKNVYWVLAFLFFVIPPEKCSSRSKYWTAGVATCLVSGLAAFGWFESIKHLYVPYLGAASLDEPANFLRGHPFLFIKMVIANVLGHFIFYVGSFVGYLGWEDTPLPSGFIVLYIAMLCSAGISGGKGRVSLRSKLIFALVAVAGLGLVVGSQLFLGKSGGGNSLDKSQGRYFIPISPLLLFLLANDKLADRILRYRLARFVPAFAVGSLLLGLGFVIRRYYIP
jgi:uncharacterized membrane protein